MRIQRLSACAASAVALLGLAAMAAEPTALSLDLDTGGTANCDATRCFMSRVAAIGEPGAAVNMALLFSRSRMQPLGLIIELPATADQQAGIRYGFANADGKTVRAPWSTEFTAPIESCDKDTCVVRIEDDITLEGHDLRKDFLENLGKYAAFAVSFQSGGKQMGAAVSTRLLTGDHDLMVAENKRAEQGQDTGMRQVVGWDVQCRDAICTMSHFIPFEHNGKRDYMAAALQFDRASGKPNTLIVQVPPDADREVGAEIGFFDRPKAPTNRAPAAFRMRFAQCDQTSCIARIASDPSDPDRDLQASFVENILNHSAIGISYHIGGRLVVATDSTVQFKPDYQTLLAELKKPQ